MSTPPQRNRSREQDEEPTRWTEEQARAHGYAGVCPQCGSVTIDCVVADAACTNDDCGYAAAVYTGTAYN
jgi:hypothetical protein